MRPLRSLFVLAAVVALAGFGNAYAFHSGGVAECGGCHSMHSPDPAGTNLLIGPDGSSTCLSCHQQAGLLTPSSYHISTASADMPLGTAPRQRTPGGDFGWLKKMKYRSSESCSLASRPKQLMSNVRPGPAICTPTYRSVPDVKSLILAL